MSIHELLTPQNCVIAFIDYQPQMFFGVASHDTATIKNNVVALAKSAKVFNVPVILSTVETKSFSGYMIPQLTQEFPDSAPIERSSMNSWEDAGFKAAVENTGRKKLVLAGLWTEVCVTFPALEAIRDGYEVYAVVDTIGGSSKIAHDMAIERMIQGGVVPVTWQQVLLEFQRDWARKETYYPTLEVVQTHSGAYGAGVEYASTMVHGNQPSVPTPEPVKAAAT